jgi:diguanylate cyclase (GGDEF)-like protein
MMRTLLGSLAFLAACANAFPVLADARDAAYAPPGKLVVTTDDNYPPFLFRAADGTLQGIIRDKWALWSKATGIEVEVRGEAWSDAQAAVQRGDADVIEALARTRPREALYEFPQASANIEARIFFHRSITGIVDAPSLRGFQVAAKAGSACADWLAARGVASIRAYPDSESLVRAAGAGEVRMFCMDSLAAEYFLFKENLAAEFRQSPVLYSAPLDWAVPHGRTQLRDFIERGFERVGRPELAALDAKWLGNPLRLPIGVGYLYALIATGVLVLLFSSAVAVRNQSLSKLVYGKTAELLSALESIRKHAARAQYFATRDPLTSLPNRQLLLERLQRIVERAPRDGKPVAVLLFDLDRFKAVNDTFGHEFGDTVLKQAAGRLADTLAGAATLSRISGDKFVAVLRTARAETEAIAARALAGLQSPFEISGQRVYCSASAGVATFPGHGAQATELLRSASIAMNGAKDRGGNAFEHYLPEMQTRTARRLELETGLRRALERGEFEVHFQPRVDIASGAVCGFEALLRWRHPALGLLSPGEFIPILEDIGLIVPVGEWVLRTTCEAIRRWGDIGLGSRRIAVNLSARQLHLRDLDEVVARIIAESGIEADRLELELTESSLLRDPEEAASILGRLAASGVHLSVDDFGTGHSSLAYLKRFPLDALKIDRTFVRDVDTNSEDAAIASAIIRLAHSLGLKVVAEGVESEAQMDFLRKEGCDEFQGFLYGPALPRDEIEILLRAGMA